MSGRIDIRQNSYLMGLIDKAIIEEKSECLVRAEYAKYSKVGPLAIRDNNGNILEVLEIIDKESQDRYISIKKDRCQTESFHNPQKNEELLNQLQQVCNAAMEKYKSDRNVGIKSCYRGIADYLNQKTNLFPVRPSPNEMMPPLK
jgi:hypothetical protein